MANQTVDWDSIGESARRVIKDFLDAEDVTTQSLARAKLATATLGAVARIETSRRAYEGVAVMMARELATNLEERQAYIAATLPDHPMIKTLQQRKEIKASAA